MATHDNFPIGLYDGRARAVITLSDNQRNEAICPKHCVHGAIRGQFRHHVVDVCATRSIGELPANL
jgi:hypothetical protein